MSAALVQGQHQGILTGALYQAQSTNTASADSALDITRALLQAGHAQQANNVAQAYLEDHTDSVEARVLAAMASLQSAPTSLATDTVSALEGVQQARQALKAARQQGKSAQLATLQLVLGRALQTAAQSTPGIPPQQSTHYLAEALSLLQAAADSSPPHAPALYSLALLQAEARLLPQARHTARKALEACSPTPHPTPASTPASNARQLSPIKSHRVSRASWDTPDGDRRDTADDAAPALTDSAPAAAADSASVPADSAHAAADSARAPADSSPGAISTDRSRASLPAGVPSTPEESSSLLAEPSGREIEGLVWGLLALVLSAEQHLDLALGAVRQGLAVGLPQHIGLLLKIEARILQATGDFPGALKCLARVLQRAKVGQQAASTHKPPLGPEQMSGWDNQVMEAWLELARTYLAAGDVENATACHKQGFDLTPEGRAVLVMQAALHEASGNTAGALGVLKQALATWPGHPRASTMLGMLLAARNAPHDVTLAEGYFRDALRRIPTSHRAWLGLGRVLSQRQQLPEALRCSRTAAELAATEPVLAFSSLPSLL